MDKSVVLELFRQEKLDTVHSLQEPYIAHTERGLLRTQAPKVNAEGG